MDGCAAGVEYIEGELARGASLPRIAGRVVETRLDRDLRGTVGHDHWKDMNRVEREGGEIDQVDVPVEATVEAEVAQVGRDAVEVRTVVAANRDGDASLCLFERKVGDGVGDVVDELVVAARMGANQRRANPESRRLARALEVEDCATLGKGVAERDPGAIPAFPAKIWLVRVAGVLVVEAMGQSSRLP